LPGSCLCWGEVEKVVGSGVEVVEWTGVEESGGKAVGGKTYSEMKSPTSVNVPMIRYSKPRNVPTDRCPTHSMLHVTQIDAFYNGLTLRHRDTINAAACGTFMKRRLEECYDLIKNMIAHHNDWDTLAQRSESSSSITSSSDQKIVALKAEMA
nr:reverse transcriptase domain-containing protein [Tanacetum cinerariifolium]